MRGYIQMVLSVNEYIFLFVFAEVLELFTRLFFPPHSSPPCYSAFARSNSLTVRQGAAEIQHRVFFPITQLQ